MHKSRMYCPQERPLRPVPSAVAKEARDQFRAADGSGDHIGVRNDSPSPFLPDRTKTAGSDLAVALRPVWTVCASKPLNTLGMTQYGARSIRLNVRYRSNQKR